MHRLIPTGRALFALALIVLAGCSAGTQPDAGHSMLVVPIEDASFEPIDAARPEGPQISVLWGDPDEGPSAMLLRIEKGAGRLHYHSSDYHLMVLQGEMKHWARGESEADARVLGQGSYWFQPGGQAHGDACLSEECLMFVKWSDRRDATLAETTRTDSLR